jgi:hypothetical protein
MERKNIHTKLPPNYTNKKVKKQAFPHENSSQIRGSEHIIRVGIQEVKNRFLTFKSTRLINR